MTTALALDHVSKRFGPTVALNDVSFSVGAGQVHALLGENGAGKSTLMHVAFGMLRPDAGTIALRGPNGIETTHSHIASPRAARAAGIGMVHQHFTSIPALTVAENIALSAGWRETGGAAERRAETVTQRLGLALPVTQYVESLTVQLRQRLEIAKALAADAGVLLLDEPTAVLAPREVDELLRFLRAFATSGGAVVLITHKLDEVFRSADDVTVLRRGKVTLSASLETQTPQSLSRAMIGTDLARPIRQAAATGSVLVRANRLVLARGRRDGVGRRAHRTPLLRPVPVIGPVPSPPPRQVGDSFEIRAGEIVGIAAIDGNGQRELLRAIAGVDDPEIVAGTLDVSGPVAFIPEDRTTEGVIGSFTLAENLLLGTLDLHRGWLDWGAIRGRTNALIRTHDIRAEHADVLAATLSGGNQQKFVFARALEGGPRVIVAEDPTRGLDILATAAIHERLRDAAREGAAVIVHSSDLDEVLALADRLFVVARGEVRELPVTTSRDAVGDVMLALEPTA